MNHIHSPLRWRRETRKRLTLADRLCLLALAAAQRVRGVRIDRVESPADVRDAAQVLDAVFGPRPAPPPELAHIEARYAAMAVTFIARVRGRPVGTLTLYVPQTSSRTVESVAVDLPDGLRPVDVIDIGRLAILPAHRGGARLVLLGLLAAADAFSRRIARTWWIGVSRPPLVAAFRRLNPTTRPLPLAAVDARAPEVMRYWAHYRGADPAAREPFIISTGGTRPSRVVTRHAAVALRGLLRRRRR